MPGVDDLSTLETRLLIALLSTLIMYHQYLFDRLIEKFRLQDDYSQLKKQMEYQNISYEKTANSFKIVKRIIHDTNKQLLYIRTCI